MINSSKVRGSVRVGALACAAAFGGFVIGQAAPARAQLGEILKGGGIAILVSTFGKQIDQFVNTLTGNKADGLRETTKVVPIVTVGDGTYVGAAQVTGPRNKMDEVKAVARISGDVKIGNTLRATAFIPVGTLKPSDIKSISRIKGVGLSAIIDYKLNL